MRDVMAFYLGLRRLFRPPRSLRHSALSLSPFSMPPLNWSINGTNLGLSAYQSLITSMTVQSWLLMARSYGSSETRYLPSPPKSVSWNTSEAGISIT